MQAGFGVAEAHGDMRRMRHSCASSSQAVSQLLQHPRMPPYLRNLYLEVQAKGQGTFFWSWPDGLLHVYKVLSTCNCIDPVCCRDLVGHNRCAVAVSQQLWCCFDLKCAAHALPDVAASA